MNEGNYGKSGSKVAINEIKNLGKDAIYIFNLELVNKFKSNSTSQLDIKTLKWFLKHSKKIDKIGKFTVYQYNN